MSSQPIRLIAVGDLSFNGRYHRLLTRRGAGWPFHCLPPAWRDADLRLGNLESPITAAPRACASKLTLRAAPDAIAALRAAGLDCVSLANNHMMDYGPRGLADTRAALSAAGICCTGAGADASSAAAPAILHCKGQRIGVFGFCRVEQNSPLYAGQTAPGVAEFDAAAAIGSIRDLRPDVDWIVVQIHWGAEMSRLPAPRQREEARRLAEAGADLILGCHPHVLQPMEVVAGAPVYYSLGNFLFSDMYWRGGGSHRRSFLAKLRLHPLSRRTGWAEVVLQHGRSAEARWHAGRLGRDLAVRPEPTDARRREWEALCAALLAPDYEVRARTELRAAGARLAWAAAWRPLHRRIEMRLVDHGLAPFAVVGD
jgi:poly-gamma-glutamate synthesis protein (capsule biosynthesis protein)